MKRVSKLTSLRDFLFISKETATLLTKANIMAKHYLFLYRNVMLALLSVGIR